MTYQYRVRDPLGNIHNGTIEARSRDDATQQLRRDGFQVLEVEEDLGEGLGPLLGGRVGKHEVIYATSQLAIMVDTGIRSPAPWKGFSIRRRTPPCARSARS